MPQRVPWTWVDLVRVGPYLRLCTRIRLCLARAAIRAGSGGATDATSRCVYVVYVCVDVLCECVYGVCGDCGTPVIFFNYFSSLSFSYPRYTQGTEATHRCDACKYDLCAACVAWAQGGCGTRGCSTPPPAPAGARAVWLCERALGVRSLRQGGEDGEKERECVCVRERERDKERESVCVCERG